jgi:iron complex transport system substrate-binding protein
MQGTGRYQTTTDGRRVVSLLPSATGTDLLIGRSHECEWEGMECCPTVVTKNRLGDSIPIDEIQDIFSASVAAVEEMKMIGHGLAIALIQYGLSVYHVDVDMLVSLRPDVILTCLQTAHSGVLEGEICDAAFENVLGYVPEIVHTNGQTMEEIYRDMHRISDVLGVSGRGEELVSGMKQRMKAIEDESMKRGEQARVNLACIQWPHPLLTCGAWVPELIHMVGANVVAGPDGPGGTIDVQDMAHADLIVFALCGLDIDTSERTVRNRVLKNASILQNTAQAILDGIRMMSRPGPLLLQSLECLAEIVREYQRGGAVSSSHGGSKESRSLEHQGSLWKWV